jgi:asparagine synthase (glutamine-hydrolysing)
MCGIAGFLTKGAPVTHDSLVSRMCDRLAHRGPDGSGYFCKGPVALGHRRLSIIDVAGGAQPLGNEDGSLQIVFNGEIYNYLELRRDLIARGHRFATQSDTEVMVHLYEEVGARLPEYLNGMFAIAIWDDRRQELFLARDRFGKKPLYYSTEVPGYRVCFASELKALHEVPGFDRSVSAAAVADFLSLGYVPDPETIYKNTFELAPAHSLTVNASGVRIERYWQPNLHSERSYDFRAAVTQVHDLLSDAVQRRMISDVPLGAFLSGGIDSSAVVGLMAQHATEAVKTFSIGFTYENYDELRFARMTADRHRTDHHEHVVSPAADEILETLAYYFDEPFGDSSAIPCLYLSNMTREHVTVALSGDGADEIFGGYRRYRLVVLEHKLRQLFPRWFRQSVVRVAGEYYPKFDYLPQVFRAKTLLQEVSMELADAYYRSMSCFDQAGLKAILSPSQQLASRDYSPGARFRACFSTVSHLPPLEQLQAVDLQTYLSGDILVKVDRASMAFSLEVRSPLLDYRLADLALNFPSSFKLHRGTGKFVLKEAVSPVVPRPAITRRKMGFQVPLADWLRTSLKPVFESAVMRPDMERYVNLAEARRLWDQHQSGLHNHDRKLWNLLTLAKWDRCYQQPVPAPPAKMKVTEELAHS